MEEISDTEQLESGDNQTQNDEHVETLTDQTIQNDQDETGQQEGDVDQPQSTWAQRINEISDLKQLKSENNPTANNVETSSADHTVEDKDKDKTLQLETGGYQQPRSTLTYSSEQIPKSNQTLKMRLKLSRVPIVGLKQEKKEVAHIKDMLQDKAPVLQVGKRKRGRPSLHVDVKQEPKKFLQISLGKQADRWMAVKTVAGGLKFHSQVAKLLLDW